jgi:hypothetical protein
MFEKFTRENSADFRQRYEGTFGVFKRGNDSRLVCLTRIRGDNGGEAVVEFTDKDGLTFKVFAGSDDSDVGFEFLPPKSAYYNTAAGKPLLVKRIASRQWRRGLCASNMAIEGLDRRSYPVDFSTLLDIFGTSVSPEDVQKKLQKGKVQVGGGIAISPQFALDYVKNSLLCFEQEIGIWNKPKDTPFEVTLSNPEMWRVEVSDAFKRSNMEAIVK